MFDSKPTDSVRSLYGTNLPYLAYADDVMIVARKCPELQKQCLDIERCVRLIDATIHHEDDLAYVLTEHFPRENDMIELLVSYVKERLLTNVIIEYRRDMIALGLSNASLLPGFRDATPQERLSVMLRAAKYHKKELREHALLRTLRDFFMRSEFQDDNAMKTDPTAQG